MSWENLTAEQIEEIRFRQRVEKSIKASRAVAGYLERQGWRTELPPQGFVDRPLFRQHGDPGDLFMWKEGGERKRAEVKWRGIDFTGAEDFPYRDLNLDRASKRGGVAFLYASTNYDLTHAALVWDTSRPRWRVEESTDKARGYRPFKVWRAGLEDIEFVCLLPPPPPIVNTFVGRCKVCGGPGLYVGWYCNQHRIW